MCCVVRLERADVAPVVAVAVVRTGDIVAAEVVDRSLSAFDEGRHDVATHVVRRGMRMRVGTDRLDEGIGVEDVVAHRREYVMWRIDKWYG